ncbi:MAG: hypothetical protein M0010_14480, partial [Actinomycetota bacterium]|nr:hypothetical protein [Actinomycetota bacterium]
MSHPETTALGSKVRKSDEIPSILAPLFCDAFIAQELVDDGCLFLRSEGTHAGAVASEELALVRAEGVPRRVAEDEVKAALPALVCFRVGGEDVRKGEMGVEE